MAFMAMELLEGNDLRELLAEGKVASLEDKLAIMEQILDGLAFAHAKGVVHRDLKPGNVHVLPNGQVKIMDFGLARRAQDGAATGVVMGTPYYMAPEQVRGERATARSDIFSLGAMFYEMLGGKRPFPGPTIPAVLFAVVHRDPEPLAAVAPDVSEGLAAVVMRALSKTPEARYADAGEMLQALRVAWAGGDAAAAGAGPAWAAADQTPARVLSPAALGPSRHARRPARRPRGDRPVPGRPRPAPRGRRLGGRVRRGPGRGRGGRAPGLGGTPAGDAARPAARGPALPRPAQAQRDRRVPPRRGRASAGLPSRRGRGARRGPPPGRRPRPLPSRAVSPRRVGDGQQRPDRDDAALRGASADRALSRPRDARPAAALAPRAALAPGGHRPGTGGRHRAPARGVAGDHRCRHRGEEREGARGPSAPPPRRRRRVRRRAGLPQPRRGARGLGDARRGSRPTP